MAKAITRWENEGGAREGGSEAMALIDLPTDTLPLSNAEIVQLQVRVIALENILAVLLAEASAQQLELVREMSAYISPRPGFTPHPLTIRAATRMINLIDGAGHLRKLPLGPGTSDDSPPADTRLTPRG